MCGHPLVGDPDVDRLLGDAQVRGDVVSGQPGLTHEETVLKSSIRVIAPSLSAEPPFSSVFPGLLSFSSAPQSAAPTTTTVRPSEEGGLGLVRARSYRFISRSLLLSPALLQRHSAEPLDVVTSTVVDAVDGSLAVDAEVGSVEVVVVQPGRQSCSAFVVGGPGPRVYPFGRERAVEAFDFPVRPGAVRANESLLDAVSGDDVAERG